MCIRDRCEKQVHLDVTQIPPKCTKVKIVTVVYGIVNVNLNHNVLNEM